MLCMFKKRKKTLNVLMLKENKNLQIFQIIGYRLFINIFFFFLKHKLKLNKLQKYQSKNISEILYSIKIKTKMINIK